MFVQTPDACVLSFQGIYYFGQFVGQLVAAGVSLQLLYSTGQAENHSV